MLDGVLMAIDILRHFLLPTAKTVIIVYQLLFIHCYVLSIPKVFPILSACSRLIELCFALSSCFLVYNSR